MLNGSSLERGLRASRRVERKRGWPEIFVDKRSGLPHGAPSALNTYLGTRRLRG